MKIVAKMLLVASLALGGSAYAGPIHEAVWEGDLDKVKSAVDADPACIKAVDDSTELNTQKFLPIHLAVSRQSKEVVEYLLSKGADPNAVNEGESVTPMHIAVTTLDKDLVDLLISKGGNVNARDSVGMTPLMRVVGWGANNEGMVEHLLDKKADPMLMDAGGTNSSVLHQACLWGHNLATVRLLIEKAKMDPRMKSGKGKEPLIFAAQSGGQEMIQYLVEKGADIKALDDDGSNLLHLTVARGDEALVSWLLEKGLDVKAKTSTGETTLHRAAYGSDDENQIAVMKLLVEKGVDSKAASKEGKTALDIARDGNKATMVEYLSTLGN